MEELNTAELLNELRENSVIVLALYEVLRAANLNDPHVSRFRPFRCFPFLSSSQNTNREDVDLSVPHFFRCIYVLHILDRIL